MTSKPLDAIYIAASARDGRFTRICVASIRHFYPDAPIRLLPGSSLESGLIEELAQYWGVSVADIPPGDWGWGFVKLEPLFGRYGERFLVLDSDTAFSGTVLEHWEQSSADFVVDDEQQTEEDTCRLYFNWRRVAAIDPVSSQPSFVFNSGQWFGTAGVLSRADFSRFINWNCSPPRLRYPDMFMPGDQGVLNYVLNQMVMLRGVKVDRRKIMRWPGHGMDDITSSSIAQFEAPPRVIHWAGMKKARVSSMEGADVLRFFEDFYYSRLPYGACRLALARITHPMRQLGYGIEAKVRPRLFRIKARMLP